MRSVYVILMTVFSFASMFTIGLETDHGAVLRTLRSTRLVLRALIAAALLVPLIALMVTARMSLVPAVRTGILLMGLAMGGTLGLQFTRKAHAPELAGALQFLFSAAGFVLTPILIQAFLPPETAFDMPFGRLLIAAIALLVVPMALGRIVHAKTDVGPALARASSLVAGVAFIVAFLIVVAPLKKEARELVGKEAVLAMVIIITLSMLVGWMFGGPSLRTRQVLMTKTSIRNAAFALVIARHGFQDTMVATTVMAYTALMVPLNFIVNGALNFGHRWGEKHARA